MIFTAAQISAIIMLLQAFGVGQATIDQVRLDLAPQAQNQPVQTTSTTGANTVSTATTTSVAPVFGAVEPTCVDSPIFNLVPTITTVPYGQSSYFNGGVQSSCSGAYLPFGQWTVAGNVNVDGNLYHGATDYSQYFFGETNNGTHGTTTSTITFSAMGVSTSTTLILLPQ